MLLATLTKTSTKRVLIFFIPLPTMRIKTEINFKDMYLLLNCLLIQHVLFILFQNGIVKFDI